MSKDERHELEKDLAEDLELTDESAENVRGGDKTAPTPTINQDVTVNKAKTADKAFKSWSGYIRG